MRLQLNAPHEGKRFEEFYGPNKEQMPLLIVDGRTPLSVCRLLISGVYSSRADGYTRLDLKIGRLVGEVAPGAQRAATLERRV